MSEARYTTVVSIVTTRDGDDDASPDKRRILLGNLRPEDAELITRHMIKMAEEWRDWFRGMYA